MLEFNSFLMTNQKQTELEEVKDLSPKSQQSMTKKRKTFKIDEIKGVKSSEEPKKNHVPANLNRKKAGFDIFWGAENISEVSALS